MPTEFKNEGVNEQINELISVDISFPFTDDIKCVYVHNRNTLKQHVT